MSRTKRQTSKEKEKRWAAKHYLEMMDRIRRIDDAKSVYYFTNEARRASEVMDKFN